MHRRLLSRTRTIAQGQRSGASYILSHVQDSTAPNVLSYRADRTEPDWSGAAGSVAGGCSCGRGQVLCVIPPYYDRCEGKRREREGKGRASGGGEEEEEDDEENKTILRLLYAGPRPPQ